MNSHSEKPFYRRIRSFVKREGRLTRGQQRALDELFPVYGFNSGEGILDLDEKFGRKAARILEIGFGNGASLAEMARTHPENDYLGIEVHRPGVGNLLLQIEKDSISNIRVMCDDAVEVLENNIADETLDAVYLFFADPWHKKKHHKRRIVQPAFAQLLRNKLKLNGIFHMATDWQDYAEHMMEVMSNAQGFENTAGTGNYIERPDYRPLTKFEQRGQRLGHGVWDLVFRKIA
ncbi:MAG: tRNA (guanosine(46)-N7)-methyltransferase TrmB [Thioalkalispiraceae bacterium]|jgi:tRNA (guanine-N7-)-methyltransferase